MRPLDLGQPTGQNPLQHGGFVPVLLVVGEELSGEQPGDVVEHEAGAAVGVDRHDIDQLRVNEQFERVGRLGGVVVEQRRGDPHRQVFRSDESE